MHVHVQTCVRKSSWQEVCRVFVFTPPLLPSCLPLSGVILLLLLLLLFQESGEAIPLMVESCICFISRHGEGKILQWSDRFSVSFSCAPIGLHCHAKCDLFWIKLNWELYQNFWAWHKKNQQWDVKCGNWKICVWLCLCRSAAWGHFQSVRLSGGGQRHQECLWER